jgi:hypothetical protein
MKKINESVADHAKAFYRGVTGKTFQGKEMPGTPIQDRTGIVPANILKKINELGPRGRSDLYSRLMK